MADVAYVAITIAFFVIALIYTRGCDRGIGAS
jgi:hypothetical protein